MINENYENIIIDALLISLYFEHYGQGEEPYFKEQKQIDGKEKRGMKYSVEQWCLSEPLTVISSIATTSHMGLLNTQCG